MAAPPLVAPVQASPPAKSDAKPAAESLPAQGAPVAADGPLLPPTEATPSPPVEAAKAAEAAPLPPVEAAKAAKAAEAALLPPVQAAKAAEAVPSPPVQAAKAAEAVPSPPVEAAKAPPSEVFAEDWWNLSRPTVELHGVYRVRAEFFHNFDLGRVERIKPFYPRPADDSYTPLTGGSRAVKLCGDSGSPSDFSNCTARDQGGANMRLRLNPDLHISDNLRIRAQIDMLDNIVLGSTPEGYGNVPGASGGYQVVARGGYAPLSAFSSTQWAPTAGFNSTKNSITVKRAWGEYASPVGQLRFGRMPSHWGLGMIANSGDGHDSDWQSTADRIMFITGHPAWDLYGAFAWDFANEGANSASIQEQQGQPYDVAQKDDVDQFIFMLMRRRNENLARKELAAGKPVIEGGAYAVYRHQVLANDTTSQAAGGSLGQDSDNLKDGFVRREAQAFIPDIWFRFRWKKLRFEAEGALVAGSIQNVLRESNNYLNSDDPSKNGWKLLQLGVAAQSEVRLLEDKLRLAFDFGYASGDGDVDSLAPLGNELQPQKTLDRTISTFRFHPDYRVDLILYRNILSRIQGSYFFKPTAGYDFLRDADGQKLGGAASLIWSRASQFVQAPGNARDLGVELNFKLYYQAKDGVLNDDLEKMGGFFTSLEYGVLFPLAGLGYLPGQVSSYAAFQKPGDAALATSTAQMVRWSMGILY